MNREDVIRMAIDAIGGDMNGQDAQHLTWRLEHFKDDSYEFGPDALLKFVSLVAAAEREKVAHWMIQRGYATGHGETLEDLLAELDWQIAEKIAIEREACAKVCDVFAVSAFDDEAGIALNIQKSIRARGQG